MNLFLLLLSVFIMVDSKGGLSYTGAKLIQNLNGNVSSIKPKIDDSKIPGGTAEFYLGKLSCLGYLGPIGSYGPLGYLGPIGGGSGWDKSTWWKMFESWTKLVYTKDGPLGENGPVSEYQYYGIKNPGKELYELNDFAVHSNGLGVWSVLGPIGPLGAFGPLGLLGEFGANIFDINENGEFVDKTTKVVRRTRILPFNDKENREYELFEHYEESFAMAKKDNDCSFMTSGSLKVGEKKEFQFTSHVDQIVTVLVVPEKQLDDFNLEILDSNDNVIASSDSLEFIDWVQMEVAAGTTLKARVIMKNSWQLFTKNYRLFVVGSHKWIGKTNIDGDHVLFYD